MGRIARQRRRQRYCATRGHPWGGYIVHRAVCRSRRTCAEEQMGVEVKSQSDASALPDRAQLTTGPGLNIQVTIERRSAAIHDTYSWPVLRSYRNYIPWWVWRHDRVRIVGASIKKKRGSTKAPSPHSTSRTSHCPQASDPILYRQCLSRIEMEACRRLRTVYPCRCPPIQGQEGSR